MKKFSRKQHKQQNNSQLWEILIQVFILSFKTGLNIPIRSLFVL